MLHFSPLGEWPTVVIERSRFHVDWGYQSPTLKAHLVPLCATHCDIRQNANESRQTLQVLNRKATNNPPNEKLSLDKTPCFAGLTPQASSVDIYLWWLRHVTRPTKKAGYGKTPKPSWYPVSRPSNSSCMTMVMEFINTRRAVTFLANWGSTEGPRLRGPIGSQTRGFLIHGISCSRQKKTKRSDANVRRLDVVCQVTALFLKGPCLKMT